MANTFDGIATATVTGTPTVVTFSNIPQTYKHLWIIAQVGTTATTGETLRLALNGDTGANYNYRDIYSSGSVSQYYSGDVADSLGNSYMTNSVSNDNWTAIEIVIPNYTASDTWNSILYHSGSMRLATTATLNASWGGSHRKNASAITSITMYIRSNGAFAAGSKINLYGLI